MNQFITRAVIALFVLSGFLFISQVSSAAPSDYAPYAYQPFYYGQTAQNTAYVNPAYGMQFLPHPVTPTQIRTGYTRSEIRSMPMMARPYRPGHFIGNTIRRRAGVGY